MFLDWTADWNFLLTIIMSWSCGHYSHCFISGCFLMSTHLTFILFIHISITLLLYLPFCQTEVNFMYFFLYLYNLTWFNYSFPQYSNQRYTGLKSATLYYLFVLPAWQNALNYFHFFLFLFPLYSVAESYLRKFMIYWTLSRRCHLESSKWIPIFKLFPLTYV